MPYTSHYTRYCFGCPGGKYQGSTYRSSCNACPAGYYCPGSTSTTSNSAGSTTYYSCPAGRYSPGSRSSCLAVGQGYWAPARSSTRYSCPAGRFSSSSYATSSSCSGCCSAGYYCPSTSVRSTQTTCGASTRYCPSCTSSKLSINAGEYGTGGGSTTRTGKASCTAGYYCTNGYRYDCPVGKFGSSSRLSTSNCNGNCLAGYYCAARSTSSTRAKCGDSNSACVLNPGHCYCPSGTTTVRLAPDGYYSVPVNGDWRTRTGIVKCGSSDVCRKGVKIPPIVWTTTGCRSDNTAERTIGEDATGIAAGGAVNAQLSAGYTGSIAYYLIKSVPVSGCSVTNPVTVDSSTGNIRVTRGIDYESCPEFAITTQARWNKASTTADHLTCTVTLKVQDKNEKPSITRCSALTIDEGVPLDTAVGAPLTATDPDRAQSLAWTFDTTNHPFIIQKCSGQVFVGKAVKYTDASKYTIGVTLTDDGNPTLNDKCTLTINVNDVSEPPVVQDKSCSIAENSPKGATICTVDATDPDGDTLTWSVSRKDDPDAISVNSQGEIFVREALLDFETKKQYSIDVSASDGTNSAKGTVIVTLTDGNDPPTMPTGTILRSVNEGAAAGTNLGQPVTGTDVDAGDSLTYSVTHSLFEAVASTGQIRVKSGAVVDYETASSHQVTIVAKDSDDSTASAVVTVNVVDVNEKPAFGTISAVTVKEDVAINGAVGDAITATDPDTDQTKFFSITSGNSAGYFSIDTLSGQIKVAKALDYETARSFTLGLKVEDNGSPKLSDTASVTVNVDDVQEGPTFDSSPVSVSLAELSADGTVAVVLSDKASDPEDDDMTFAIVSGNFNDIFEVKKTGTKSELVVATGKSAELDFEGTRPSFDLEISITDGATNSGFTSTGRVKITLTNVQEAPVFVRGEEAANTDPLMRGIQEKAPKDTKIGAPLSANDPDNGDTLTYAIVSQEDSNNYFRIDSTTGQLLADKALPEASSNNLKLVVSVSDGTATVTANVEVGLVNTNDPPTITGSTQKLDETTAVGTEVLNAVRASDPDNHPLTYQLVSGAHGAFALDTGTGKLTVSGDLDYETRSSYTMVISVTDQPGDGIFPLTASATVTININNINEAPVLQVPDTMQVREDAAKGDNVGSKLVATDEDAGETFTYSIIKGNDDGAFAITNDGQIQVNDPSAIDYETTKAYALDAQVQDGGKNKVSVTVRIEVIDANDAPKLVIVDPNITIPENTAVGTRVGTLQATDADIGDSVFFELANHAPHDGTFDVIKSTGAILLDAAVNFETRTEYELKVYAEDSGGLTSTGMVYIKISDSPDPPAYSGPASATIDEHSAKGTVVFTATATDEDKDEVFTFSISAGNDDGVFEIEPSTGKVKVRDSDRLNYESGTEHELTIQVTDSDDLSASGKTTVILRDVNEPAVILTKAVEVAEADSVDGLGHPYYSVVGDHAGSAPIDFTDQDFNQTHSIRIVSGNKHGLFAFGPYVAKEDLLAGTPSPVNAATDASAWVMDGFMLYVRNTSHLDFEGALHKDGRAYITLGIELKDNGSPVQTTSASIEVDIVQRNERPTIEKGAVRKVDENSPINALVGLMPIGATDPDMGDIMSFKIESGDPDKWFKIDPCGGQIKVAREGLDFETKSRYDLVVSVTDDGNTVPGPASLSDSANVTIMVLDVNEPPTLLPATLTVAENSVFPTTFGSPLTVLDEDIGQTHNFTIAAEDSDSVGLFDIDLTTGQMSVKTSLAGHRVGLDYEFDSSFVVTVRVTDSGTRPANLWSEAKINIKLTDVNEPPVVTNNQNLSVAENSEPGTRLAKKVKGDDFDAGSSVSFSIVQDGSLGARLFTIDSVTGEVAIAPLSGSALNTSTTHPELDFEMRQSTWFTVRVNDSVLYTDANVNVAITDVNEPPSLYPAMLNVSEDALAGTVLAGSPLRSSDIDNNQQVTYRISSSLPASAFVIDALTGELSVAAGAKLDFETAPLYRLVIVATDSGVPRLSATADYAVTIIDAPERPEIEDSTAEVNENSLGGISVANVTATDVDEGDVLSFAITAAVPAGVKDFFAIDSATGAITVAPAARVDDINHEQLSEGTIVLTVTVTDSFSLDASALVTITVKDVAEAPTFNPPAVIYKAARTAGTVGESLTSFVIDQDEGDSHRFELDEIFELPANTVVDIGFELDSFGTVSIPEDRASDAAFQTGKRYRLTGLVVDSTGLSAPVAVVIEMTDNNIAPELLPASVNLDENSGVDTLVINMQATDINVNDATFAQDVTYRMNPAGTSVNKPFPFNITTEAATTPGQVSRGRVFITASSPVDFELESVYYASIVATDNHPTKPLSTQAILTININDLPEAPAFPSDEVTASVLENSAAGTQVGLPVVAFDEDIADAGKLVYEWTDAGSAAFFDLDRATGRVTVAAGADLNHEVTDQYRLGVRVTDTQSLTDTTTLVVSVVDVNEPPTFSAPSASSISEASGINTVVASMSATDQDEGSWGVLSFFLTDDDGANGAFRVDSATGQVLVNTVVDPEDEHRRMLDFEDRTVYNLAVGVRDAGGLNRTGTITVTLTDANDLSLVGFTLKSDSSGRAVQPAGSMAAQGEEFDAYAAILDTHRVDVVAPTAGGIEVWMHGRGFGSTAAKLARDFPGQSSSDVHQLRVTAVSLANSNNTLSVACSLVNDTTASCVVPEGAGAAWTWDVEILNTAQAFTRTTHPLSLVKRPVTGYIPPNITRIFRQTFVDGTRTFMSTLGGEVFTVQGTDLGNPGLGFSQEVKYGPVAELWDTSDPAYGVRRQSALNCRSVDTQHTMIECRSRPGLGALLEFFVRVEGQDSTPFIGDVERDGMRYAAPVVTSVELEASGENALFDTAGGDRFVVRGSNFGPEGSPGIAVWYGETGFGLPESATPLTPALPAALADRLRFTAVSCHVVGTGHNRIECVSTDGVGTDLVFAAAIRGLASAVPLAVGANAHADYKPPVIDVAEGSGWRSSPTEGGVAFSLIGEQFGPIGLVVPVVRYGPRGSDPTKYTAVDCTVTGAHTVITCNTNEGSGFDHVVRLSVRGQSASFGGNLETVPADSFAYEAGLNMTMVTRFVGLAYSPPVVTRYDGAGAVDGNTVGSESVIIEGLELGPVTEGIQLVTYGLDNSSVEYEATNCSMTTPHTKITCHTAEGAGAGLRWVVWIDGQRSRAPTTDYHEPVITSVIGPGAVDAWTDGGQQVNIRGMYFGPSAPSYLEDVTYGRTGTEFVAEDCVVVSHTMITCKATAGTGRGLRWRLAVRGQDSGMTTLMTNYNDPDVRIVSPPTGTTSGVANVRFYGFDFGITEKRLGPDFTFVQPSNTTTDASTNVTTSVIPGLKGAVPCSGRICVLWDNKYYLRAEDPSPWTATGQSRTESAHSVTVQIPEGAGQNIPMQLVLKTGPGNEADYGVVVSNTLFWSYQRPSIDFDIGKERVRDRALGVVVKLTIQGQHFSANPQVFVFDSLATYSSTDRADYDSFLLTHCTIMNPHRHIECLQSRDNGFVVVGAADQYSDPKEFSKDTPTIGNLQGAEWDELRLPTAGGYKLEFEVHSIDPNNFVVSIQDRPCVPLPASSGVPFIGAEFIKPTEPPYEGAPSYLYDEVQNKYHTITCLTPEGAGVDQRLSIGEIGQTNAPQMVRFADPTITSWRAVEAGNPTVTFGSGLPSTSGALLEIMGGNFSAGCSANSTCADTFIGLFSPAASEALPNLPVEKNFVIRSWTHDKIMVEIEEGEGTGFLLGVTAAGLGGFTSFGYAPPVISTHTLTGPTTGGVPMSLGGSNFGVSPPTVVLRRIGGKARKTDLSPWSVADKVVECPYVSHTHTSLTCMLPSGQGRFWKLEIVVAEQAGTFAYSTDDTILDTQAFAYDKPVLSVLSPVEGVTAGGFLTTLQGANLGTAEAEVVVRVTPDVPLTAEDWSGSTSMPMSAEATIAGASAGWVSLHRFTEDANAAIIAAALADPAAAVAALPSSSWRSALLTVGTGDDAEMLDEEDAPVNGLAVAAILAQFNGTHTHNAMSFRFPEGQGASIEVVVNVAGQVSEPVSFTYERPNITAIEYPREINTEGSWPEDDGSASEREVMTLYGTSFGLNSTQRTKVLLFRPAAEYEEEASSEAARRSLADGSLAASAFSPTAAEENDAVECNTAVMRQAGVWTEANARVYSHTLVQCPVPRGWGRDLRLAVKVMDRYSATWSFSYDPAEVDYFTPNTPSALGTHVMSVYGKNFGPEPTPLDIRIGGVPCNGSAWVRDSSNQGRPYLRCTVSEDNSGVRNMTIFVAGQDANPVPADGRLRLICPYNWYGIEEPCLPCPIGGICKGDLAWPYSEPGFWDLKPNNTVEAADPYRGNCPAERLNPKVRTYCAYIVGCKPASACSGNNTCTYGYEGVRCKDCLRGKFYRRAGECVKCPDLPLVQLLAFVVAVVAAGCGAYAFQRYSIHLASIQIAIDYFQVLAMIARAKVPWPPLIKEILLVLSAFNLNLELAAPECLFPDLGYPLKWAAVAVLPVAAFVLFGALHVFVVLKKICMGRDRKKLCNHSPSFAGSMLMLGFYAYMVETRNSLDVFNCSPTVPDDGFTYLESVIERCGEPGGVQAFLAPFAGLALLVYSIGYPAILGYLLYTRRDRVRQDQILRVFGIGNSRLTNPNSYVLRKYLSKLYQHFRPEYFYWVLIIILRKAGISVVALMFRENPAYQLSCALLVMFCSYAAQVRFIPYMAPNTYPAELAKHQRLVTEGEPLHNSIANAIAPAVAHMRHQQRQRARAMWGMDAPSLRKVAITNFFDYNTTEAILLGCGVFTCLAGIMFQSGALDASTRPEVVAQKETITWVLTSVLILSILYVLVVVGNEAYAQFNRGKTVAASKGGKKKGGKKGGKASDGGAAGGKAEDADLLADGDIVASKSHTDSSKAVTSDQAQLNPMFMSGDGGAGGIASSATHIVDSDAAPDAAAWQVVRTEFGSMQTEIAELKRQLEERAVGGRSVASRVAKQRFTHSPMRAAGAATPEERLGMATEAPGANPLFKNKGAAGKSSRRGASRRQLMPKKTGAGSSPAGGLVMGSPTMGATATNPMAVRGGGDDAKAAFEPQTTSTTAQ